MHEQVITDLANVSEYIAEQWAGTEREKAVAKMLTGLQVKKLLIVLLTYIHYILDLRHVKLSVDQWVNCWF